MKKLFVMAALAVAAASANAQDDLVKQAKKLASDGDLQGAVKTLTPALTSDQTADKAAAWNEMSSIQYQIYMKEQQIDAENKVKKTSTPYDTLGMHRAFIASFEAALVCDEYDRQPNEKGKVKLRFRENNAKKYQMLRVCAIQAGQFEYGKRNMEETIRDWTLYVESAQNPLFTGIDMSQDEYKGLISYYAALAAYNIKDYATATKYASIAVTDSAQAANASEILLFSKRDGAKTAQDSTEYAQMLKDLRAQDPDNQRYFNLLMDYYAKPGRQTQMKAWVEEEIAKDSTDKMPWALKGQVEMSNRLWDDAIASFSKAAEIDPSFVQVLFNLGVCYNSKATELKDKVADKNTGMLTKANADKVKAIVAEAKTWMEKAKEIDPSQQTVKWAYPLYQIYYNLGDQAKAAEMEKLVGQ